MCLKEIGLSAKNLLTILGSMVNIIERNLYDHLIRKKIFTLIMHKINSYKLRNL